MVTSPVEVLIPFVTEYRLPSAETEPTITPMESTNVTVPLLAVLLAANVPTVLFWSRVILPVDAFRTPSSSAVIVPAAA